MTFEQRFERGEEANHTDIWKKSQPFKNLRQEGAGMFEGERKIAVSRAEWATGRVGRGDVRSEG